MYVGKTLFFSNEISKCIRNVLYILKLANNILSINELIEQSLKVEFEATKCWLNSYGSNKVIVKTILKEGYIIIMLELFNPWLQNVT
jgi:hypothetical protein